jgi:hypothetical protein
VHSTCSPMFCNALLRLRTTASLSCQYLYFCTIFFFLRSACFPMFCNALRRLRTTAPRRCQYLYFCTRIFFFGQNTDTCEELCGHICRCQYLHFCTSVCTSMCTCVPVPRDFALLFRRKPLKRLAIQVLLACHAAPQCQYLYFCTSKASKLSSKQVLLAVFHRVARHARRDAYAHIVSVSVLLY